MTASIKEALEPHPGLRPCPFCGEKRIFFNPPDKSIGFKGSINCQACGAEMPREVNDDQELIDCWNTRVTPASLESGEARERIAQIVDAYSRGAFTGWKGNTGDSKITLDEAEDHFTLCMQDLKDAILATGCAPDEASIRADQKERDAKVALIQAKQGATAEQIAAAIRAGRGEG